MATSNSNSNKHLEILLVEDDMADAGTARRTLHETDSRYQVTHVSTLDEAKERLDAGAIDAVLVDLDLPCSSGLEPLTSLQDHAADVPILVLTSREDGEVGTEAVRRGAQDYLVKAQTDGRLMARALQYAIERKRTQEALRKAREKAQEADRAKSAYLALMSHDVRAPMNTIIGYADLMRETELTTEQQSYLKTIIESSDHLLELIDDILDLSRIEAGALDLKPEPFAVADLARRAEVLFAREATKKELSFKITIDDDVPRVLHGDAGRIKQLLANLVGNAIKFTPEGSVSVHVSAMPGAAKGVHLRVKDTGIGIPAGRIDDIFRPFVQLDGRDQPRRSERRGTGLGLAICKSLVDAMEGEIRIESVEGEGTTVDVRLPLVPAHWPKARPLAASSAVASNGQEAAVASDNALRILVVEDEVATAGLLVRVLEARGHTVDHVLDGRAAVEAVVGGDYDAVTMDIQLPEVDGLTAIRTIKSQLPADKQPAIVVVTAHAMRGDRERFLEGGADAYVSKPLRASGLLSALEGAVRHAS